MNWGVFPEAEDGNVHVVPVDDEGYPLAGHEPHGGCPCRPRIVKATPLDDPIISHREPRHPGAIDTLDA